MNAGAQTDRPITSEQVLIAPSKIPQMDALRVLAMFGIFFHHLGMTVIRDPHTMLHRVFHDIVYCGANGVMFFNIMSGFLLAYPYLGSARRPFPGYGMFMRKRFFRIIPPYYILLVIFSVANIFAFGVWPESAFRYFLEHALFVNSFDQQTLNLNTAAFWYLGMLAHFYLLFPFILRLFQRVGPTRAALSLFAFCYGVCGLVSLYFSAHPDSPFSVTVPLMYFNLPVRLPEFAVGMWLAAIWNPSASNVRESGMNRPFTLLMAAMVLYALICVPFFEKVIDLPYYILNVSVTIPLFVLLFLWRPMARAGGFSFMGRLSQYSFGIFMVHQPIFSYLGVMPGKVPSTITEFLKLALLVFPLCYVAAAVLDRVAGKVLDYFQGKPRAEKCIPGRERSS